MVFAFPDVSEGEIMSVHCTINLSYIHARTVAFLLDLMQEFAEIYST
jgi:hypothetical protein